MKKFLLVLLVLLLILGGGLFYVYQNLESIVKTAVNKYGSQVTGTEVTLGGFQLSPLKGEAALQNLRVANPQGYQEPHILSVGAVYVKLNVKSLLKPVIVVEEIRIDKPAIAYELKDVTKNNVSELLANINKNTAKPADTAAKEPAAPETAKSDGGAGKKVVINVLSVTNGEINLAASLAGKGANAAIPLPTIELKDIGREKGNEGKSIAETASDVLKKILDTAYETVVKQGFAGLKNLAEDSAKALEGAAQDLKDSAKGLLKGIF